MGFLVALDRPEIWLFWGPYGLWLFWRDPGARALVAVLFVITPIVWFLPVYLGCGSFSCSVNRATHPRSNSLAFASNPFVAELKRAAWPTMLLRIKVVAALLVIAVTGILWNTYRRSGLAGLRTDRSQARLTAALLGRGRAGVVRGHRDHDPGRLLGQQPLPGAGLGAGRHLRRRRLWLGRPRARRAGGTAPARRRRCAGRDARRPPLQWAAVGAVAARLPGAAQLGRQQHDLDPPDARLARLPGAICARP